MTRIQDPSATRSALIQWFRDAEPTFEDLNICSVMAAATIVGSASSNLVAVPTLDTLTRNADLWFLTHPCPVEGFGLDMSAITALFTAFARLIFSYGGDGEAADDGTLASRVESTSLLLADIRAITLHYAT